jgi:hypothetical protein
MSAKSFAAPTSVVRPAQILQSVAIKVVEIRLRSGEDYVYSQRYDNQNQKREISSKKVTQGGGTLWRHVDLSYRFADNLLDEVDCVEIVVIRKAPTAPIEQVWRTGEQRNTIPSYFDSAQWTDDSGTVCMKTDDVIEIRLKGRYPSTPSPERAGDNGRAARCHITPPPQPEKLHPANNPNLLNAGPAQARFVAMRACLQRLEY